MFWSLFCAFAALGVMLVLWLHALDRAADIEYRRPSRRQLRQWRRERLEFDPRMWRS